MYWRCPQKAPFLIPPATAKFALAPDGEIDPPPVTKSDPGHGGGGGGAGQAISAPADAMITTASPRPGNSSALTRTSPQMLSLSTMLMTSPATAWRTTG